MRNMVDSVGVAVTGFGRGIGVGCVGAASDAVDSAQGLTLLGSAGAACEGDHCII